MQQRHPVHASLRASAPLEPWSLRGASILSAFRAGVAHGESGLACEWGEKRRDTWGDQELHVDVGRWLRPALPSHRHVTSGPADLGARPADSSARLARVPSWPLALAQEAPPKMGIRERSK